MCELTNNTKLRTTKLLIVNFFFIFFLFLTPDIAGAFSLSPPKQTITIAPGAEQTVSVTIKNESEKTKSYFFLVLGAKQDNEGHPVFGAGTSEAEEWVKPEQEFVSVGAGKEKTVNFFIKIPDGAYPGFYYLGLAAQERNLESGGIGLSSRLISILSLQVAGEAQEILNIRRWGKEKNIAGGGWQFTAVLENKGNVDLPLRGVIVIKDWGKREVLRQKVYLGNNLLPQMKRDYNFELNSPSSWSPWYWAEWQIDYGRMGQNLASTRFVWGASEWKLKTGLAAVVIGLPFLWFLFKKKKSKI